MTHERRIRNDRCDSCETNVPFGYAGAIGDDFGLLDGAILSEKVFEFRLGSLLKGRDTR